MRPLIKAIAGGLFFAVSCGNAPAQVLASAEARLVEKNITLPTPAAPVANFVGTVQVGHLVFVSGHTSGPKWEPKGKVGQVINAGRDDDVRHVVADTFSGFLAFLGEQFKLGRVTKKHGTDRIVIGGEDRDFIQTLSYSLGFETIE